MSELPRKLTEEDIDDVIMFEDYHHFPETCIVVCCLTLTNGYNVIGQAGCIDPELFDFEIGKKYSYIDAKNKIWQLEGYILKEAHYQEALEKAHTLHPDYDDEEDDNEYEEEEE